MAAHAVASPRTIILGYVPFNATEEDVVSWFVQRCGPTLMHSVHRVDLPRRAGEAEYGSAFVQFTDDVSFNKAQKLVQGGACVPWEDGFTYSILWATHRNSDGKLQPWTAEDLQEYREWKMEFAQTLQEWKPEIK